MSQVNWTATPDPKKVAQVFAALPGRIKDRVYVPFGQYLNRLIQHIRSKKLSGQVLKKRTGRLYESTGAEFDLSKGEARILTTRYGEMWEHTGHKQIVPVNGCKCPVCSKSSEKWLHFKTADGKWVRTRSVKAQDPRPFIKPSIEETDDLRRKLVVEPLARTIAAAFRGESM